jgi:hypothetical protein
MLKKESPPSHKASAGEGGDDRWQLMEIKT